jgi:MFS family permease
MNHERGVTRPVMPRGVWALGFVSLFMDISSEMIHGLLPVFMVSVLGASAVAVGLVEGIAEATASVVKIFSGTLSDRLGKRKLLAGAGYGLAAVIKPLFPLATSVTWVLAARFVDRIGKGIRGAPRDAMVADLTPPALLGAAYGLRQSMDTAGAFAGPLLAIGLMSLLAGDIRAVFWFAVIPAFISVAILIFAVHEPPVLRSGGSLPGLGPRAWSGLGAAFWWVVSVGAVLTLARFSEAFLIMRAGQLGMGAALVPLILVVMNIAYALSSYPAGVLSDRLGRFPVLAAGIACLVTADLVLAWAMRVVWVMGGVFLWGLHMGLTQGLLAAMVAETAPAGRRGTAFGVFNLVAGIAMLLASLAAGALWDLFGAQATFLASAAFATLALTLYVARQQFSH